MSWTTYYNRSIEISELSHQHLSNILWYFQLVFKATPSPEIQIEIDNRFGGIRLPYKPMHSFVQEIDFLFKKGYITNKLQSDIIVDGRWVGELIYN